MNGPLAVGRSEPGDGAAEDAAAVGRPDRVTATRRPHREAVTPPAHDD